jgi:hypothetical protein
MALRFHFNIKALEATAKEFRRASWGAAAASAAVGYHQGNGLALLFGACAWLGLQVLAFILESLQDEQGDES